MYDVIIIGAGVVGMTMALALAQKTDLQIGLIDSKEVTNDWKIDTYGHRVSALSLGSTHFFQTLGVWETIQARRISPYHKMQVWEAGSDAKIDFDGRDISQPILGYIIEDEVIKASLWEQLVNNNRVTLLTPCQLVAWQETPNHLNLTLAHGECLQAKLCIAADGGKSWVREQANISSTVQDYNHHAIVATVQTECSHELTARQCFLPDGPLAFLPLLDKKTCSIVWSVPPARAETLLQLSEEAFLSRLTEAFEHKLGRVTSVGKRYSFSLHMRHAKQYVKARLALIGDAAHSIHPLAGQGMNLGLLDVACLLEVIQDAVNKNRDFASVATLRRYERARRSDNALMLTVVGGIQRLFGSHSRPVRQVRALGVQLTDRVGIIKQIFATYAAGCRL